MVIPHSPPRYPLPSKLSLPSSLHGLQAVSIHLVPTLSFPTVYNWSPSACHLFASGGKQPDYVYVWDLLREHCHSVLPLTAATGGGTSAAPGGLVPPGVAWPPSGTSPSPGGTGVDQLLLSSQDPNLLVPVCTDGTLRVFDLRAPAAPRMVLQPFGRAALAGAVLEPGGRSGVVVVAAEKGDMRWMDLRGGTGSGQALPAEDAAASAAGGAGGGISVADSAYTFKTVQAHTKGGLCALAGHSLAPLLATGTSSQAREGCGVWGKHSRQTYAI